MPLFLFAALIILILIGVPIALSLLVSSGFSLLFFTDTDPVALIQRMFVSIDSFTLMALPFFMIAGGVFEKGGVSKRLVDFANSIVGGMHGGLAIVAFIASAFFGAISGSSTATVIAIGALVLPTMLKEGYDLKFSVTTLATAGILGTIIPPSIPMITYGVTSGASIGDLFAGGIIPGIMLTLIMSSYAYFYGKKNIKNNFSFSFGNVLSTFKAAIWALLMPIIIIGGIYSGFFTPTESAVVAIFYGLIISIFIYKEMTVNKFLDLMRTAVINSSMILFIVGAAGAFGFVMTKAEIPLMISDLILSTTDNPIILLLLINIMLLIIGMFLETNAAILIVAPILLPIVTELGVDPVHFGIVMIVNLSIGLITPPLGVNLFVATRLHDGVKTTDVLNKHLVIYIALGLVVLLLITYIPILVMLIPNLLG
ncbi:TRAP transporter large permease [Salinicoccus sp. Marseille-QA3877]